MSHLNALLTDLRERRVWPLAALLLAAIVAIPVVLSKHPAAAPVPSAPSTALTVGTSHTGPTVSVDTTPVQPPLKGQGRNPFSPQGGSSTGATTTTTSTAPTAVASAAASAAGAATQALSSALGAAVTSASGGSTSAAAGGSVSSSGGSSTISVPAIPAPTAPSTPNVTPAPAGLTSHESYDVALSVTDTSGNVRPADALPRLSPVPSAQQPLLLELGVLQGGHNVLFVVESGTLLNGAGACLPGPLDCQLLSLAPGQTETLTTPAGAVLFQITGISKHKYASVAAASQARRAVSASGSQLFAQSTRSALSLFPYEPSLGVVVDQRNLVVGGN